MIKLSELNKSLKADNSEHEANLLILHGKINKIREAYGRPMTVTSGYRTMEDHLRIYREIANKKGIKFDPSKVPMKSKHLSGQAVDIYDPKGELHLWCQQNESFLEDLGVWLEHRQGNWQHFQIAPFRSYKKGGTIWFHP